MVNGALRFRTQSTDNLKSEDSYDETLVWRFIAFMNMCGVEIKINDISSTTEWVQEVEFPNAVKDVVDGWFHVNDINGAIWE